MNNFCKNHPNKVAFSFCHNCGKYYCKDCLIEGDVYYYCKKPECISALDIEKKIAQPKSTRIFATLSGRIVAVLFDFFFLFILSSILAIPFYFNNPKFVYDNLITDFGWFVLFRNPFGYFISLIYFISANKRFIYLFIYLRLLFLFDLGFLTLTAGLTGSLRFGVSFRFGFGLV